MPEGPECHYLANLLNEMISGKLLTQIEILGGRYSRHGPPSNFNQITEYLETKPMRISFVKVKGKFIYWELEDDWYLTNTLGMTGQYSNTVDKHCHLKFSFVDHPPVYFRDIRNFGTIGFVKSTQLIQKLGKIGEDILLDPLPDPKVISLFRKKPNWTLPKFVMNQTYLSGIGNYLKCEALFASKISPHTLICKLSDRHLLTFYQQVRNIAKTSYQNKGASFHNFADPDRIKGKYSYQFKVYGHTSVDGKIVIKELTHDKRTTYWVPELQVS